MQIYVNIKERTWTPSLLWCIVSGRFNFPQTDWWTLNVSHLKTIVALSRPYKNFRLIVRLFYRIR